MYPGRTGHPEPTTPTFPIPAPLVNAPATPAVYALPPAHTGVGQYQHDVNQGKLAKSLDAVVEDCVNHVGVDLNTASEALLVRVAGLSASLAKNIVAHRDANGPFLTRKELLKVSRLGPQAFEQAAGFLRIPAARTCSTDHGAQENVPHVESGRGIGHSAGDPGPGEP